MQAKKIPNLNLRFSSKAEFERIKRAAKDDGRSLNSFILRTVNQVLEQKQPAQQSQ